MIVRRFKAVRDYDGKPVILDTLMGVVGATGFSTMVAARRVADCLNRNIASPVVQ